MQRAACGARFSQSLGRWSNGPASPEGELTRTRRWSVPFRS
uniref:Uncharacterized protein n=1 Tax=Arundo donax TaxID=35708 RepID=A0A0A9G5X6_ARUDO